MSYFYEDEGRTKLKKDLLTTEAQRIVKSFCHEIGGGKVTSKLGMAQTRRWYGEIKRLEHQMDLKKNQNRLDFDQYLPMVKLLKARLTYATKRPMVDIPEGFSNFMFTCIDNVESYEDFKAFALYFEAVLGFASPYLRK